MVNFYYKRVIDCKKKWTEIPNSWSDDVIAMLTENGYTLNEDGTVTKTETPAE